MLTLNHISDHLNVARYSTSNAAREADHCSFSCLRNALIRCRVPCRRYAVAYARHGWV